MTSELTLTPEQVQRLWEIGGYAKPEFEAELRRMGLIAPEPVDPLLEEAEALHQDWIARKHKDAIAMLIAALRRGMELRPPLTRERVREMLRAAVNLRPENTIAEEAVDRALAALTDGGRDG